MSEKTHRPVQVPVAIHRRLKVVAARADRTLSDLLEEAADYLEAHYPPETEKPDPRAARRKTK